MLNRRNFLKRMGAGGLALGGLNQADFTKAFADSVKGKRPPNFVFMLCDDLGWGDLGCYGNPSCYAHPHLKTPNLDKLAEQGLRFTNAYANSPVCTPSRVGVMTGCFPSRLGIHYVFSDPDWNARIPMPNYLDHEIPTVTCLLQQAGYVTGHFGKWHLGGTHDKSSPPPEAYGINTSATILSSGSSFRKPGHTRDKDSERIINRTIGFVEANRDKPFYVNTWLTDPHSSLTPNKEQMDVYKHLAESEHFTSALQVYYSVVTDMDRHIGRLLKKLDELSMADNTIVIFSSDNGPAPIWGIDTAHSGVGSTGPFRGCKASLYEGGIRVPFIVRWPGRTPPNQVDDTTIISFADLLPTFCSLAGKKLPEDLRLDGEDMSGALMGKPQQRTKPLKWEYRFDSWGRHIQKSPILAMRNEQWKLLMNPDWSRVELYDLNMDPSEVNNRADQHADVVKQMSKQLMNWHKSLPDADKLPPNAGAFDYPWPKSGDLSEESVKVKRYYHPGEKR